MSVSVVAVPTVFAIHLTQIVGAAILTSAIQAAAASQSLATSEQDNKLSQKAKEYEDAFFKEVSHIQINEIIEKEFETAYMDKELLLKTLEEHGLKDIEEDYDGKISGSIENFTLSFSRESADKPYIAKISCRECDNAEEKLSDLNAEYALNAQEDAYLNLVENLKEKNLEIEEEVVEEDNTIVLTINLE